LYDRWAGGNGSCAKLVTASYDGSVRMMDPATATFELLVTDEEAEYSAMDCLSDATSGCAMPCCSNFATQAMQL